MKRNPEMSIHKVKIIDGHSINAIDNCELVADEGESTHDEVYIGHSRTARKFKIDDQSPWFPWLDREVHLGNRLVDEVLILLLLDLCCGHFVSCSSFCLLKQRQRSDTLDAFGTGGQQCAL